MMKLFGFLNRAEDGSPPQLKKILIGAAGLVLVIVIAFVLVFSPPGGNGDNVVGFEFSVPPQAHIGEPFPLLVTLANPSDKVLKDARLAVELPNGISFVGQPQSQRIMEQTIGDLGPGSTRPHTFNLIAVGGAGEVQSIRKVIAELHYHISGSSAAFTDDGHVDVVLGQPAIALNVQNPAQVTSGEEFEIKLEYESNSSQDFDDLALRIEYSPSFAVKSTSRKPDRGNNQWDLGSLTRGARGELSIKGSIVGPEQAFYPFNAILIAKFAGQEYTINTSPMSVGISSSPLAISLTANSRTDYVATIGDGITYTLTYRNNASIPFENLTVRAKLTGALFDLTTAASDAFFNSVNNTFTWTVANTPMLARLGPGEEGQVQLSVGLKQKFPITRLSDKDFLLKVDGTVESPTVMAQAASSRTIGVNAIETKIRGNMTVDAQGFFRDARTLIINEGPFPPRVNQPTQYTIHWRLTSEAVDVQNIRVAGFLQSGARWTGVVKSNVSGTLPKYEESTGRVVWEIDSLSANRGIVGEPAEAIFQIEATPAVNQVGGELVLVTQTNAQGTDAFTGTSFTAGDAPITTALPDDLTLQNVSHAVEP